MAGDGDFLCRKEASERIAEREEQLVTGVLDVHHIGNVIVSGTGIVPIVHEGMELTAGGAVLIGCGNAELVDVQAYTSREAVGGSPVGIVGCRAVIRAFAVERAVLEAVGVVHGRYVIVANAQGEFGCRFELCTELQGGYSLQGFLGVAVHHIVALRVVRVAVIPVVVIAAGDVARVC